MNWSEKRELINWIEEWKETHPTDEYSDITFELSEVGENFDLELDEAMMYIMDERREEEEEFEEEYYDDDEEENDEYEDEDDESWLEGPDFDYEIAPIVGLYVYTDCRNEKDISVINGDLDESFDSMTETVQDSLYNAVKKRMNK